MTQRVSLLTTAIALLVTATALSAGVPKMISYQGRATVESGSPVTDGDHSCMFQLFDHPTAGSLRWTESATVQTTGGLFTHLLGSVVPLPDTLFAHYDSLYLQVRYEGQFISPRTPIVSTGYALRVNSVDGASGGTIAGPLELDGATDIHFYPDMVGNGSVYLPDEAIGAREVVDEPGVGSCNNASIVLPNTPEYLCGRTMFAPTDGYVLVIATARVAFNHVNGIQSTCSFGVSDNISNYVISARTAVTLAPSVPSGAFEFPIMSHALFPIAAGSAPYYALGSRSGTTSAVVISVQLTECFFPTAYTTVTPPTAPPSGPQSFDANAERLEAEAFLHARVEAELAKMKAEFEAIKLQLEQMKRIDDSKE